MPVQATVTWVCPSLCGCKLDITAQWTEVTSAESYRHPIPGTVTGVAIRTVCATHDSFRTDPLATDPYDGRPGYIQVTTQANLRRVRRYLSDVEAADPEGVLFEIVDGVKVPYREILPPGVRDPMTVTEAERVYIHLSRYAGQRWRPDTCGCVMYQVVDQFTGKVVAVPHAQYTRKCKHHRNDDDTHTQAVAENRAKNEDVAAMLALHPTLTADEVVWSFDASRRLLVSAPSVAVAFPPRVITIA